ncbi:MAG: alpha/beta hydrolase domain-containing protein [Acidobacteria bacterium]|nr:alpha/beta hydrolase domain-containing protein [Acidobacteriota bacterium]
MMRHSSLRLLWAAGFVVFACFAGGAADLRAQSAGGAVSCNEFLVPRVEVKGKQVGQESCQMIESDLDFQGRKFRRLDMGISGTVAGYTLKDNSARYANYINEYPEIVYPQAGVNAPFYHGIGRYEAAQGTSVTLMYPEDRSAWNGKMYVTAHGAGRSFKYATLKTWDRNLNPADPLSDISKYEKLMLEKGYALAKTRRSTLMTGGDLIVTLDDGTVLRDRNLTEQPSFIMGLAKLAENVLERRLGRKPSRTYWYGHSGGARPGRMVNYKAGLNVDTDGTPIIDGIIADDAGAGLWVPAVIENGKDILFATEQSRERFVPQIDITHLLYVNETPDDPPSWRGYNNFTASKRMNAKLLRDKGLGDRHRVYEIAGISHSGGEYLPDGKSGDIEILDMSRIMDGLIDILDNWVEKGIAPPPSKSDWAELGDADQDGILENGPVALPEVACPLGVYHIFPPSRGPRGQSTTGFAPFTGEGLEPEDGRGHVATGANVVNTVHHFVDMNQNGYRDFRETVTQAWLRLGLLEPKEKFSRQVYTACVQESVENLKAEGFITSKVADFYLQQAATMPLPGK